MEFLDGPLLDVSGTTIRARVQRGWSVRYLVPDAVVDYIEGSWTLPSLNRRTRATVTEPVPNTTTEAPRADGLPKRRTKAAKSDLEPLEMARRIVDLAEDKKAADIVLLDLAGLTTLADYFVIASGGSERQIDAIADGIASGLRDTGIRPIGREGTPESHWVLLDFGSVIVHVFTPPERDYYQLEKHWSEAKTILRVQ